MTTFGRLLAGTVMAGGLGIAAPASAQMQGQPAARDASADEADSQGTASQSEVTVTGSRIRRSGADNPTPTTVLTSDTIERSGVVEIADLVNEVPSMFPTQTNQTTNRNGSPGLNALNLRGLGTQRTLVLVNGRRRVAAVPGSSAVDVSAIPAGLVERVEVITGGASALYGADAVAGVANFILKKNFTGFQLNAMSGISTRGDLRSYNFDALYGIDFHDGRGNLTLYANYNNSPDEVTGQDRPWTASGIPIYTRATPTSPLAITDNNRNAYNYANGAVVELGGKGNLYSFNADGTLRPIATPADILNLSASGSNLSTYLTNSDAFGGRYDDYLLTVPTERMSGFGSLNYELGETIRVVADAQYSRTLSNSRQAPRSTYGLSTDVVPASSPFITAEIRAANGGTIPAAGLVFARRFTELGPQRTLYRRSTFQGTFGFEGKAPDLLAGDWDWSLTYSFGQTRQETQTINATASGRFTSALSSGGTAANPICTSATARAAGCVALNPFLPLTAAMINYLQYSTTPAAQKLQQHVVSGYTTGSLFNLPYGPVQAVLGAEYRSEYSNTGVAPEYNRADPRYDSTLGVTSNPLVGRFNVKEAFAELRVPLLKRVPVFHELTVEGAARLSDYSTAGRTNSWKVGGEWAPVADLRFRGGYGQAVRAPNISELFVSSSISRNYYRDPCNYYDVVNRANRTSFTVPNCTILNPANRNDRNSYYQYIPVTTRGNPDLKVETAKTLTAGGVLTPRFLRNLSFSVDYFDIKLNDAVSSFDAQTILEKCVDAPTLDNVFCSYVSRQAGTNNLLGVTSTLINLSEFRTRGIDFEFDYRTYLSALGLGEKSGSLSLNAVYTRLLARTFTLDPTNQASKSDTNGVYGTPTWKGVIRTTYSKGPFTLNWTMRHFSGMRPSTAVSSATHTQVFTPDMLYHDAYISIQAGKAFSFYGGARNLFDKEPPRFPGAEAGGANFENGTTAGVFDVIGRTMYVGARLRY